MDGHPMKTTPRNPLLTVDIIIEMERDIVLIERLNPPFGWAIPGGFVDYGESVETAAVREAREETSLIVDLKEQFQAYSDPERDPRHHTVSIVFIATGKGTPKAEDDAKNIRRVNRYNLPRNIVFDHNKILNDYFRYKNGESKAEIFSQKQAGVI